MTIVRGDIVDRFDMKWLIYHFFVFSQFKWKNKHLSFGSLASFSKFSLLLVLQLKKKRWHKLFYKWFWDSELKRYLLYLYQFLFFLFHTPIIIAFTFRINNWLQLKSLLMELCTHSFYLTKIRLKKRFQIRVKTTFRLN